MPEPKGNEPLYAQKAAIEVREAQLLRCQETKGIAIDVIANSLKYAADVQAGRVNVEGYTAKGESYIMDGKKYILEQSTNIKSLVASVQTIEGAEAAEKNVLHVAILGRGAAKPRVSAEANVISVEVVEE